jgi:acyl-CoA dehydrogenase
MSIVTERPPDTGASLGNDRIPNLKHRTQAVAAVAKASAAAVDGEGRFPREALEEMRRQRLLGIMIPKSLGGEGTCLAEVVDTCYTLGQACSSTALIYAMHQVKVGCITRHGIGNDTIEHMMRRIASDQLLIASSTTEGTAGGNVRSSEAAIERDGDSISLTRKATVISYGAEADGIVTTARHSPDAAVTNQVLLVLLKGDYTLDRTHSWDALGMRGTHSEGYLLRAKAPAGQILADSYDTIHARTMVPHAHLLWSAVWAGIATAATANAQAFVRLAARHAQGRMPPGAANLARCMAELQTLRGMLAATLRNYEHAQSDERKLSSLEFQSQITLLKVQASELAVGIVLSALRAAGLAGYRNDSEFSIGRQLRDVLSAPLMIHNDRMLANAAPATLMLPLPTSISS